jgi:hypothetical protein
MIVDQDVSAAGAADVLAQRHDLVATLTFAGLIGERGDVLAIELEVEELAFL